MGITIQDFILDEVSDIYAKRYKSFADLTDLKKSTNILELIFMSQ